MKHEMLLRAVGVIGIVAAFMVFAFTNVGQYSLVIALIGIIALVSPEVLDQLPFGPTK
jgi:hypothetical protein